MKLVCKQNICIPQCSTIHNNQSIDPPSYLLMDEENVIYVYNKLVLSLQGEGNPAIYGSRHEPGKRNKPGTERQILKIVLRLEYEKV